MPSPHWVEPGLHPVLFPGISAFPASIYLTGGPIGFIPFSLYFGVYAQIFYNFIRLPLIDANHMLSGLTFLIR